MRLLWICGGLLGFVLESARGQSPGDRLEYQFLEDLPVEVLCGPDSVYILTRLNDGAARPSYGEILQDFTLTSQGTSMLELERALEKYLHVDMIKCRLDYDDLVRISDRHPVIRVNSGAYSRTREPDHWIVVNMATPDRVEFFDPPRGIAVREDSTIKALWNGEVIIAADAVADLGRAAGERKRNRNIALAAGAGFVLAAIGLARVRRNRRAQSS